MDNSVLAYYMFALLGVALGMWKRASEVYKESQLKKEEKKNENTKKAAEEMLINKINYILVAFEHMAEIFFLLFLLTLILHFYELIQDRLDKTQIFLLVVVPVLILCFSIYKIEMSWCSLQSGHFSYALRLILPTYLLLFYKLLRKKFDKKEVFFLLVVPTLFLCFYIYYTEFALLVHHKDGNFGI